jgi:hypothetical protein
MPNHISTMFSQLALVGVYGKRHWDGYQARVRAVYPMLHGKSKTAPDKYKLGREGSTSPFLHSSAKLS